jgi:hypothetical protein
LSAIWNPDNPIEDIWIKISSCQAFVSTIEPISNNAGIRLTLTVFEKTGVFASAVNKWGDKPTAEHTLPIFIRHFNFENKERCWKLTAQTAGYHHGAHQAAIIPASPPATAAAAAANAPAPAVQVDNVKMHHCHAHGLSRFSNHTSATCSHPCAVNRMAPIQMSQRQHR